MAISLNRKKEDTENSNMYIESDALYLRTGINGIDFTAYMDTGGDLDDITVIVSNDFYRKHMEQYAPVPSKTEVFQNQCWVSGTDRFDFFKPDVMNMQLGNYVAEFANETAILTEDSRFFSLSKDGYIGLGLLKKLKRITFDFKSMRIDCE